MINPSPERLKQYTDAKVTARAPHGKAQESTEMLNPALEHLK
jgi:hypothetical protein